MFKKSWRECVYYRHHDYIRVFIYTKNKTIIIKNQLIECKEEENKSSNSNISEKDLIMQKLLFRGKGKIEEYSHRNLFT